MCRALYRGIQHTSVDNAHLAHPRVRRAQLSLAVRSPCSRGDPLVRRSMPGASSKEPVLDVLAKLQLSAPVGVSAPSPSSEPDPALWKSPKSPNESNAVSSIASSEKPDDENVNGSASLAAAASEKGPKASCSTRRESAKVIRHTRSLAHVVKWILE